MNAYALPWFIFDLYNVQLITSATIPSSDIADSKQIILSEVPVPGLGFNPVFGGGMGNRKVSFTLPLLNKDNNVGNLLLLQQFENLRNQALGLNLTGLFGADVQFASNPKVLFFWGIGSGVPLEWFVSKCDYVHKSPMVSAYSQPQYTEINIELVLDELSPLTQAENVFRLLASYAGMLQGAGVFKL
jgi:hypothetical protein